MTHYILNNALTAAAGIITSQVARRAGAQNRSLQLSPTWMPVATDLHSLVHHTQPSEARKRGITPQVKNT